MKALVIISTFGEIHGEVQNLYTVNVNDFSLINHQNQEDEVKCLFYKTIVLAHLKSTDELN